MAKVGEGALDAAAQRSCLVRFLRRGALFGSVAVVVARALQLTVAHVASAVGQVGTHHHVRAVAAPPGIRLVLWHALHDGFAVSQGRARPTVSQTVSEVTTSAIKLWLNCATSAIEKAK